MTVHIRQEKGEFTYYILSSKFFFKFISMKIFSVLRKSERINDIGTRYINIQNNHPDTANTQW